MLVAAVPLRHDLSQSEARIYGFRPIRIKEYPCSCLLNPASLWTWWDDIREALMFNRLKYPSLTILLSILKGLTNWILRIFVLFAEWFESTITNSSSFNIYTNVRPMWSGTVSNAWWCYHTTYFLLPHRAMYMAFSFHTYNHARMFACVLLVPTLLCMMRHTKGLLRYLYRSNYRLQLTVFSTCTFPSNTVGDCKYSSGIAHCCFDAQEQVHGVQGDPSTP